MSANQAREEVLKAYRVRLDESAVRLDQLRRTYADIPESEYHKDLFMVLGNPGAEIAFLRERFGERPLVPRRTVEEVRAEERPLRIIGGRRSRRK